MRLISANSLVMEVLVAFNGYTKETLVYLLTDLVQKLDELDKEDFFGTEGWRHFLDLEEYDI